MLLVHQFKTGEIIQRFPNKKDADGNEIINEYGRLIVCEKRRSWQKNDQGQRWLRKETRVGFVQGLMSELEEDYGHLEVGDVAEPDMIIQRVETTKKSYDTQEPKQKPAKYDVDGKTIISPAEDITHKGALVYMNYFIEDEGTEDILLESDKKKVSAPTNEDSLLEEEEEPETPEESPEEEETPEVKGTAKKK